VHRSPPKKKESEEKSPPQGGRTNSFTKSRGGIKIIGHDLSGHPGKEGRQDRITAEHRSSLNGEKSLASIMMEMANLEPSLEQINDSHDRGEGHAGRGLTSIKLSRKSGREKRAANGADILGNSQQGFWWVGGFLLGGFVEVLRGGDLGTHTREKRYRQTKRPKKKPWGVQR